MNPNEFCKDISSDIPDWSREKIQCLWDPGRKLLALYGNINHARLEEESSGELLKDIGY